MCKPYDIWVVQIMVSRVRGRRRWLNSKRLTLTQAQNLVRFYERSGHRCRMETVENPRVEPGAYLDD